VLRDQLGAGQMAFEIKKISNYGTQHPVVARLKVQTHELVQWADLSDEEKGQVKILYFGLADRLLKCYEVYNRLTIALKTAMEEVHQSVDHRTAGIPHLIGLQGERRLSSTKVKITCVIYCVLSTYFSIKTSTRQASFINKIARIAH
jgi:hypothetical protein